MNKRFSLNIFFIVMTVLAIASVVYVTQQNKKSDNASNAPSARTNTVENIQTHQAYIKITPSRSNIKAGETFSTLLTLGTENVEKNGVHILLQFDPKILQVIDNDPAKAGIQVAVTPDFYEAIGKNSADNVKGTVEVIASSKKPYIRPVEPLAVIKFKAIGRGKSYLSFDLKRTSIFFTSLQPNRTTNFDRTDVEIK